MATKLDLKGQIFGSFKVLCESERRDKNYNVKWICQCTQCGALKEVRGSTLKSGYSAFCNCAGKMEFEGESECVFFPSDTKMQGCRLLTERLCETTGNCSFWKEKE